MGLEEEIETMLERAEELIEVAEYLHTGGYFESVANRIYYAEYTAVCALLHSKDLQAKTHKGAHALFSEHYFKTGILPSHLLTYYTNALSKRQDADYTFLYIVTEEEASKLIEEGKEFLQTIRNQFEFKP